MLPLTSCALFVLFGSAAVILQGNKVKKDDVVAFVSWGNFMSRGETIFFIDIYRDRVFSICIYYSRRRRRYVYDRRRYSSMSYDHGNVNGNVINVNDDDDDVVVHINGYTFTMNKTLKEEEKCNGLLYKSDKTLQLICECSPSAVSPIAEACACYGSSCEAGNFCSSRWGDRTCKAPDCAKEDGTAAVSGDDCKCGETTCPASKFCVAAGGSSSNGVCLDSAIKICNNVLGAIEVSGDDCKCGETTCPASKFCVAAGGSSSNGVCLDSAIENCSNRSGAAAVSGNDCTCGSVTCPAEKYCVAAGGSSGTGICLDEGISETLEPEEQAPTFRMTATESQETRKSTQRNNVTDIDTLRDVSFDFSAPVSDDVKELPPTLLNSDVYTLVFVTKMDALDYSISLLHFKDILSIRLENATAVCNVTLSDNTTLIVRTPPKVITTGWHHLLFKAVKFAESKLFGVQIYVDGIMVASKNTTVTLECATIADRCQKPEIHGKFGPSQRVNLTVRSFLKFDTALPERQVEKQFLETDWIEKMTQSFTLHLTNLSGGEMDNYNRNETFLETVRDEGVTALFLALKNSKAEASLHLREEDVESSFAKICDANDTSCNVRRGVSRRLQHLTSGRSLVMEYKVSVRQKNKERLKRVMESWSASDTAFDRRLNKSLAALPPYVMVEKVQQSAVVAYPEDRYFESAKEAAERSLRATTSLTTQAPTTSAPNESSKPVHISSSNDTAWWVILLVALLISVLLLVAVWYAAQWFITNKVQQKQTINKDFFARILEAWLSNPQSQLEWDAEVPKELFDVNPIRSVGTKSRAPSKTCATHTVPTSPFPSNS